MAFHEIQFPANLSFGSVGGPERRTEIVTLSNGFEERNTPWAHSRRRYDAGIGLRSLDDVATYTSGAYSYVRPIAKPIAGTVRVAIGGDELQESIDYDVDVTTGEIIFAHPPDLGAEVRAGYEFDVPVRFDTDTIQTSVSSFRAGDAPNVPIIEVRL